MLPSNVYPTYEIPLLSKDMMIMVRPFLVKEEKLLLMAAQSKDANEIAKTTLQVVSNCITSSDIDASTLPFYDIDHIFLTLRAKSIGESIDVEFVCNNVVDGEKCGQIFPVKIDLVDAKVFDPIENRNPKIDLSNGMGIKLRIPSYMSMKKAMMKTDPYEAKVRLIYESADFVWKDEDVFTIRDFSFEDFSSWIENLTKPQFEKIEEWIDSLPTFKISTAKKCTRCGFDHKIVYDDFDAFFL